ncbi:replication restart DNA helicase PriA [Seinonella peptonophila]|uniref:Replication restart protein PriA n=1 Tax=Seinonella peptonophila TaxID=112248 RepID=A0A1M4UWB5_9BACL|nr:primosomal protein N' [Seinonella peptonophila]SHE60982.1 replication restart DNA helicase PriA [Seinonella peptonophila]
MENENKVSYAEVVVDVPATPTDRPFDYRIPTTLQDAVQVGSRVQVPFGSQRRIGYVTRIKSNCDFSRVRSIIQVMDVMPPLTEELVELGDWIADEYMCHRISALQAMVPAVLRGKYQKLVSLTENAQAADFSASPSLYTRLKKSSLDWEEVCKLPDVRLSWLREWVQQGKIQIEMKIHDRVTEKKVRYVSAIEPSQLLQIISTLPERNKKQRQILQFFIDKPEPIPLKQLLIEVNTTRSTITKCVEENWLFWEERQENRNPYANVEILQTKPLLLTKEQQLVYSQIERNLFTPHSETILLHGVTGSGKTELYLQAIAKVLDKQQEAIVLVPEISLTPQMVERFKGRFGDQVAVLHSGLSHGEKYDEWRKIREGHCSVAIGARSAIFAPFTRLGLIIIDEEHESSYKQEDHPKYHARAVAQWRAKHHGATLLLGSATPAMESYYQAENGEYRLLELSERVQGRPFPAIELVDMRNELRQGNRSMFSKSLQRELQRCIERGEQAVLFLNRRGFSTFVMCRACGETIDCPHCEITLTYHRTNDTLRCHYCGYATQLPSTCPKCESPHIRHFGTGTQRVEEELLRHFPQWRIIRMDVDTTTRKGSHQKLLGAFGRHEADILLGTQMIAKGLDFPLVTLVGVITADTMLHLPDFRSAERTFQLLTQVSGRAGRHQQPGKVVIQSYSLDHYSIRRVADQNWSEFYKEEYDTRKKLLYPPFCGLVQLLFTHPDQIKLLQITGQIAGELRSALGQQIQILGPVPAMIPRIKDRYRIQILLKFPEEVELIGQIKKKLREIQERSNDKHLRIIIDRDGHFHIPEKLYI